MTTRVVVHVEVETGSYPGVAFEFDREPSDDELRRRVAEWAARGLGTPYRLKKVWVMRPVTLWEATDG